MDALRDKDQRAEAQLILDSAFGQAARRGKSKVVPATAGAEPPVESDGVFADTVAEEPEVISTAKNLVVFEVPFHGVTLIAARDDKGDWVSVSHIAELMGIDQEGARQFHTRQSWSCTCVLQVQLPGAAQSRPHFMLARKKFAFGPAGQVEHVRVPLLARALEGPSFGATSRSRHRCHFAGEKTPKPA